MQVVQTERESNMGKIFKTKLTTATIVLIPACIGINYLGKLFASLLKLPLWLDSIGTCIGACLGGPVIGAICGAANNLIYGLTTGDNITLIYAITSLGIGLVVGILARMGFMKTFPKSLDEIVVDVPDKIITIIIVYLIVKGLPKKLTALYDVNAETERLD